MVEDWREKLFLILSMRTKLVELLLYPMKLWFMMKKGNNNLQKDYTKTKTNTGMKF